MPAVWEYLKSATASAADRGTYVPWNFTKFLVDRKGRPAGRYDVDEDPFSMRDDIFAQLTNSGDGSGFTNLTSGDGTAPPTLELGSGPFRLPTGTAGLTAGSGLASATTGGTAHATAALVEASPRDPAAAIAGLGKYYIHNGNEPFDRGPVERPTKPRTGASRFSKAIEHFKKKRASDGVPLPAVPYTPMSPRPEICGAILVTYSGMVTQIPPNFGAKFGPTVALAHSTLSHHPQGAAGSAGVPVYPSLVRACLLLCDAATLCQTPHRQGSTLSRLGFPLTLVTRTTVAAAAILTTGCTSAEKTSRCRTTDWWMPRGHPAGARFSPLPPTPMSDGTFSARSTALCSLYTR